MTAPLENTPGDTDWFVRDRFGMFIHWGLYSVAARHEWVQFREEIPGDEYARLADHFDADRFDPAAWADAARAAGMKYVVVTAKHHEGFCLWDSPLTDFSAAHTAPGRDLLRPVLDAFRAAGLRTGIYYSLIDWHHPDFLVDDIHPDHRHPDRAALNASRHWERYVEYLHAQVRQLLTEYGDIDILWADYSYDVETLPPEQAAQIKENWPEWVDAERGKGAADWRSADLLAMIRELRPGILVNDRLGLATGYDITTPEQGMPAAWPEHDGRRRIWEACQTFSGSWGYHREEQSWKTVPELVAMLAESVSKGGNLLLNVGPTARGEFDDRARERLTGIGEWMARHDASITGCTAVSASIAPPDGTLLTWNPETGRIFVHLVDRPTGDGVLAGLALDVEFARVVADGSEVVRTRLGDDLVLTWPAPPATDEPHAVVELIPTRSLAARLRQEGRP